MATYGAHRVARETRRLNGRSARRTTLTLAVATAASLVAGAAFAFWAAPGAGSAAAGSASPGALTLTPGSPTAQLHPGGQAGVALTIANPHPATVRVGSLALDTSQGTSGFAVDGAHSACGLSALSFATQSNAGTGWTVSGNGSLPIMLAGSLAMATSASNACQGATFTVFLKVAS
jgi:hypothetical protein